MAATIKDEPIVEDDKAFDSESFPWLSGLPLTCRLHSTREDVGYGQ